MELERAASDRLTLTESGSPRAGAPSHKPVRFVDFRALVETARVAPESDDVVKAVRLGCATGVLHHYSYFVTLATFVFWAFSSKLGRGDGTLFEPLGRVRDKRPGRYPGLHARQHVIDACDWSLRRLNHPDQPVGVWFARD